MSLKMLLTSDVHLGMKFSTHPKVQGELAEARFITLSNLVQKANKEHCDLFVVAGDLFERVNVAKRDILRAAQTLREFQGNLVAVLPGNHDFMSNGQNNLWTIFEESAENNVLVLKNKQVEPLQHYDLDVNLYPAPCDAKNSCKNSTDWIKNESKDEGVQFHIGVAHGSLEGFSPDFESNYFPMTQSELEAFNLDLWLLGHTHIQYPKNPGPRDRIFYPATPEPDGFDCNHEGKAWILKLDDEKNVEPVSISTGKYRFVHRELTLLPDSNIESLITNSLPLDRESTLLKLKLKGRIMEEEYEKLEQIRSNLEDSFFDIKMDYSDVARAITPDIIDREFTEGSFPHRLLTELAYKEEDWEALQVAYDMINGVKK
ncbi:metallophosphoesterase family protein [Methanosarcina barkeri]|uniref:DNA double-strand break repair protein Mre11 n=1 Tax=Methanosarcina barkeri 227 TaxID=1434106 RepID=A0A0E3R3E3_METBA|nr:DNA repair exonuclease [Methanosarcina barkeri]AKB57973.1 DNA double-strand break repair protein Mre11 [Methanosarcina barkeri 227]